MPRTITFEGRSITVPDDATDEEVADIIEQSTQEAARAQRMAALPQSLKNAQETYSPTAGMNWAEKTLAGAGKAFYDVGRGAQQLYAGAADLVAPRQQNLSDLVTGRDPSRSAELNAQVEESRRLDAPLMESGWAKAGNLAGNVAIAAPTL